MEISLRRAIPHDSEMLWEWRNDYETRMNSVNTDLVGWPEHIMWFSKSLAMLDRKIFIAENNKEPVGTVRFDYYNDSVELSWTIAPEHRGKGYGAAMLKAAIAKEPTKDIYATIKPENHASAKIAKASGFVFTKMENGLGVWKIDKRRGV